MTDLPQVLEGPHFPVQYSFVQNDLVADKPSWGLTFAVFFGVVAFISVVVALFVMVLHPLTASAGGGCGGG